MEKEENGVGCLPMKEHNTNYVLLHYGCHDNGPWVGWLNIRNLSSLHLEARSPKSTLQ
jgi:hypothetical protein